MASALSVGENVHIIAYDVDEKQRIVGVLTGAGISLARINFVIAQSDDVWVRDTGPMFLRGDDGRLVIVDFGFDGWGKKVKYKKDDKIPAEIATHLGYEIININEFVLEGGAIELDGNGTLMATLSSVCSKNRNKKLKLEVVESYLKKYYSVTIFIWLEGVLDEDITDAHIDGMARFAGDNQLLTVSEDDFFLLYEGILESDYDKLTTATNAQGVPYDIVEVPLTAKNVEGLDYRGSYLNYYVGNEVVIVPIYNDINDSKALGIIASIYPNRKVVPIDVTKIV